MLEVRDLRFSYVPDGFGLRVPSLRLDRGKSLVLGGPSGTGKTTLLKLLAGILVPGAGQVLVEGTVPNRLQRLQTMGLIFQDFALLDYLTVWDNVLLPLRLGGLAKPEHDSRAAGLLGDLEIEKYRDVLVRRLSQGEQQRVAIARALVHRPTLILADEPTSALDRRRCQTVTDLLLRQVQEQGSILVVVTHDSGLAQCMDKTVDVEEWVE